MSHLKSYIGAPRQPRSITPPAEHPSEILPGQRPCPDRPLQAAPREHTTDAQGRRADIATSGMGIHNSDREAI